MNTPILNTIRTIILIICLNCLNLSNHKPTPIRLHPKPKETWTQRNYGLIMAVLISILIILTMALFITMCFAFTGNTEANQYYYHMGDI